MQSVNSTAVTYFVFIFVILRLLGIVQSTPVTIGDTAIFIFHSNTEKIYQWLKNVRLKANRKIFIVTIQKQVIFARNYEANIIKKEDTILRLCEQYVEIIDC